MWAGYKRSCGWPASVGCGRFFVCVSFAIALVSRLRSYSPLLQLFLFRMQFRKNHCMEEWGVGLLRTLELAKQYIERVGRDVHAGE